MATDSKQVKTSEGSKPKTTNKEVQDKLKAALKDIGSTKKRFETVRRSYDNLYSDKTIEQQLKDNLVIGHFIKDIKNHVKATKQGDKFNDFVKTYFPRLNAQYISNVKWLAENEEQAMKFVKGMKHPVSNPEVIKRNIRKALKDDDSATDKDYERYGMKAPAAKKTEVEKATKTDDKVINLTDLNSVSTADLLNLSDQIAVLLFNRAVGKRSKDFSPDDCKQLEMVSLKLADTQVHLESKAKVESNNLKNQTEQKAASAS